MAVISFFLSKLTPRDFPPTYMSTNCTVHADNQNNITASTVLYKGLLRQCDAAPRPEPSGRGSRSLRLPLPASAATLPRGVATDCVGSGGMPVMPGGTGGGARGPTSTACAACTRRSMRAVAVTACGPEKTSSDAMLSR